MKTQDSFSRDSLKVTKAQIHARQLINQLTNNNTTTFYNMTSTNQYISSPLREKDILLHDDDDEITEVQDSGLEHIVQESDSEDILSKSASNLKHQYVAPLPESLQQKQQRQSSQEIHREIPQAPDKVKTWNDVKQGMDAGFCFLHKVLRDTGNDIHLKVQIRKAVMLHRLSMVRRELAPASELFQGRTDLPLHVIHISDQKEYKSDSIFQDL